MEQLRYEWACNCCFVKQVIEQFCTSLRQYRNKSFFGYAAAQDFALALFFMGHNITEDTASSVSLAMVHRAK